MHQIFLPFYPPSGRGRQRLPLKSRFLFPPLLAQLTRSCIPVSFSSNRLLISLFFTIAYGHILYYLYIACTYYSPIHNVFAYCTVQSDLQMM